MNLHMPEQFTANEFDPCQPHLFKWNFFTKATRYNQFQKHLYIKHCNSHTEGNFDNIMAMPLLHLVY